MPTLKTIYDSYPEPKSTYQTFTKRLRNNKKEIDAIMPERQSKNSTTTIKRLYESYPQPKCSYNRFWVRLKRGIKPDEAVIQRNKYHTRIARAEKIVSLEKEISELIEKRSKYDSKSNEYYDIQEKKNKLVRELSVYKSR